MHSIHQQKEILQTIFYLPNQSSCIFFSSSCSNISLFKIPNRHMTKAHFFIFYLRDKKNCLIKIFKTLTELFSFSFFFRPIWIHVYDSFIRARHLNLSQDDFRIFGIFIVTGKPPHEGTVQNRRDWKEYTHEISVL